MDVVIYDQKDKVSIQFIDGMCGFEMSGEELLSAIHLYINTKFEMDEANEKANDSVRKG